MSTLQFPSNPVNGQLYPSNPSQGDIQYQYDAAANTWRLLGAATGVIAGTYGSATEIPQFTVTSSGAITFAQNFPLENVIGTLQTVTDNGNTTTNPMIVDLNGETGLGFSVVDSAKPIDRFEVHPTYLAVRNGKIYVQENANQGIILNGLGDPHIEVRRDGYISLGSGTNVYVERLRLNGNNGSATFDGLIVAGDIASNESVKLYEGGILVAEMSPRDSFFNFLNIGGLNYPTADAPPGYIMTTDGLGNLTLQPAPAVQANALQAVTDVGNTTTNSIEFVDVTDVPVITVDPVNARITIAPQAVGQAGVFIEPTDITFNGDTFSLIGLGTNPASLNFAGSAGVDLTTNNGNIPFKIKPGGLTALSVTGSETTINTALTVAGLSYPTVDGTNGQVLTTDGNGNITFASVIQTVSTLQTVTGAGNTTTNSIIIEGATNVNWPLEVQANSTKESIKLVGNSGDNESAIAFFDNSGSTLFGYLEGGPTYLAMGIGTNAPKLTIDSTGTTFDSLVTANDAMVVSGNVDGIYQVKTVGLGGISVNSVSNTQTAYIQGNTGNIYTTGRLEASGLTYPTFDGTPGQVISTDGNGNLGWGTPSAGTLQSVTDNGNTSTNVITVAGLNSNGTSNLLGPVNAESVQIGPLTDILNLDAGFANVADTIDFGGDMVIFHLDDPISGVSNRILVGSGKLILGTQGGSPADRYYSELVVVEPGDGTSFPNTSYVTLGYGDGTQKLETTSTGITINGDLDVGAITASGAADFASDVNIGIYDPVGGTGQLSIGSGGFQIYNEGIDTYLQNTNANQAGNVFIGSNDLTLQNFDGSIKIAELTLQGDNIFYRNNTEAIRLTSVGTDFASNVNVLGAFTAIGTITASGITYPAVDGTAGQFLTTNGSGSLSFTSVIQNPTLQQITDNGATTTDSITVGGLTAAGLSYPTADGSADQVLSTDGAGTLGWITTAKVVASPVNSASAGVQGQIAFGTGFFYWHDGTQWLRVAGSTF